LLNTKLKFHALDYLYVYIDIFVSHEPFDTRHENGCLQVKDRLKKMGHLQPLNIFLRQEIDRMQRVVTVVRNTLSDLKLAIDGTIIMSENLRDALDSMYDARIPATWKRVKTRLFLK